MLQIITYHLKARNNLHSLVHAKNGQVFPYETRGTSAILQAVLH